MEKSEKKSEIQEFFKWKNVFITGATGFLGKILIEKLLRSTEVATLYILVREKKGKKVLARVDDICDDVIFNKLKTECPKFQHRIVPISGDISVSGLGLNITDRETLISNVDVVFHLAATVNFDENMKLAFAINVEGTKAVLDLGREMKRLKSIVHVSTAYAHCHRQDIDEKFYDCTISYKDLRMALEKVSKEEVKQLTPKMISPWPNTYTFTKALAEDLIKNEGAGLPIGVFRPTMILSTYQEPVPGWIDNMYGPTGICAGGIAGVIRVFPCDKNQIADIVPVDTCVAGLIATAWDVANKNCERTSENIDIYNYVSSPENPVTWNEFSKLIMIQSKTFPTINSLWPSFILCCSTPVLYWLFKLIYHVIPAFFLDLTSVLSGHTPRMLKMYKKIHKLSAILRFFCTRSWKFSNQNTVNLWTKLNKTDQELFPLSISRVHWLIFFRSYVRYMRLYLLKDPEATLEDARKRNDRLNVLNSALKLLVTFLLVKTVTITCYFLWKAVF